MGVAEKIGDTKENQIEHFDLPSFPKVVRDMLSLEVASVLRWNVK